MFLFVFLLLFSLRLFEGADQECVYYRVQVSTAASAARGSRVSGDQIEVHCEVWRRWEECVHLYELVQASVGREAWTALR